MPPPQRQKWSQITSFCRVGSCPREMGFQYYLSPRNAEIWWAGSWLPQVWYTTGRRQKRHKWSDSWLAFFLTGLLGSSVASHCWQSWHRSDHCIFAWLPHQSKAKKVPVCLENKLPWSTYYPFIALPCTLTQPSNNPPSRGPCLHLFQLAPWAWKAVS